jgi:hypothetical protein
MAERTQNAVYIVRCLGKKCTVQYFERSRNTGILVVLFSLTAYRITAKNIHSIYILFDVKHAGCWSYRTPVDLQEGQVAPNFLLATEHGINLTIN